MLIGRFFEIKGSLKRQSVFRQREQTILIGWFEIKAALNVFRQENNGYCLVF
jgi:hypothetical protein